MKKKRQNLRRFYQYLTRSLEPVSTRGLPSRLFVFFFSLSLFPSLFFSHGFSRTEITLLRSYLLPRVEVGLALDVEAPAHDCSSSGLFDRSTFFVSLVSLARFFFRFCFLLCLFVSSAGLVFFFFLLYFISCLFVFFVWTFLISLFLRLVSSFLLCLFDLTCFFISLALFLDFFFVYMFLRLDFLHHFFVSLAVFLVFLCLFVRLYFFLVLCLLVSPTLFLDLFHYFLAFISWTVSCLYYHSF